MRNPFRKKEIFKVKSVPLDPASFDNPTSADQFQKRGMAYYARQNYSEAEVDLKKAASMDGDNIDVFYSLGMVLKAANRKDEAVVAFKQALSLINARTDVNKTKYDMLRKLALGHINEITQGDWNLEKEIWKRTT